MNCHTIFFYIPFFHYASGAFKEASWQLFLETGSKYIIVSMEFWSISVYFYIFCLIYDEAISITLNKITQFQHLFMYQVKQLLQTHVTVSRFQTRHPNISACCYIGIFLALLIGHWFYSPVLYSYPLSNLSSSWFSTL